MQFRISHNAFFLSISPVHMMKYFSFLLTLLLFGNVFSQNIPDNFKNSVDSLIHERPSTYAEIDAVLKQQRNDTTLMRYFANQAMKKEYFDGQAYAINQLGRKYRNTAQFSQALALHQRALEIAENSNNVEFKIYALNMLGVVYRRSDAIQAALDYYQQALELAENIENPYQGIKRSKNVSLNGIGNIYKTLEQYEVAIDKFEQAMELDKELNNKLGLAINNLNIGECHALLDNLDKALQFFQISLSYNDEINSERGKIFCQRSIANVYLKMDKNNDAVHLLQNTLIKAKEIGDNSIISSVEISLGAALLSLKNYKESKKYLNSGLQIAKKINTPGQIAEANKYLSEVAIAQKDFETALRYYKISQSYDNEISNNRNLRYVNDMIMRYESEKRTNEFKRLEDENALITMELKKNKTVLLISGIALALLAGIFYILYRQYQLNNEKKLLTLEQSMLRSQMNPHFLFNSLNSIKLYIINNEQKNAVYYLNKFSKLVRKILEASSLKEIPLAEELETAELYMNIENIRFSNEINFKTTIEDGFDTHVVKIPSLILQPFLENALWHGLSSKEGEKNITLEIGNGDDESINIAITDNGIGRAAAEKIKEGKVLKRKSVGIDITKERLDNFARDYQNSCTVEMIDLYDQVGKPSGTKVVLQIPTI